jgi:hypothetical protein
MSYGTGFSLFLVKAGDSGIEGAHNSVVDAARAARLRGRVRLSSSTMSSHSSHLVSSMTGAGHAICTLSVSEFGSLSGSVVHSSSGFKPLLNRLNPDGRSRSTLEATDPGQLCRLGLVWHSG